VQQVDLRFPREGIDCDALSDGEKEQWEELEWGDNVPEGTLIPERVNASALNNWLFNKYTVDQGLQHLMEHGNKVEGGDRLGKTILLAIRITRNLSKSVLITTTRNMRGSLPG